MNITKRQPVSVGEAQVGNHKILYHINENGNHENNA